MDFKAEEILSYTEKVLSLIAKYDLAGHDVEWIINETLNNYRVNCNPRFLEYHKCLYNDNASVEWTGSRTGFNDLHGRKYIDCLGSGAYNLGHRHPKVVAAVKNQLERQVLHSQMLLDPLQAMLSKLVAMITPGNLQYSFFTNSGLQSVDGALKLARIYTKRPGVIAAVNGYHEKSIGSLYTATESTSPMSCFPILPFFQYVPFGDADILMKTLASSHAVGNEIGAVILEPIQVAGGIVIPPEDYFNQVRDICDHYGALLIVDETLTGMGRTGMLFAIEHYGVIPDIICLGSALCGGVMPIGAYVSTAKFCDKINSRNFIHSTNLDGNPLACAAAIATIEVILDEGLVEQAAEKGSYLLPQLQRLADKHPMLKEARGKGLLIGLEFKNTFSAKMIAKSLFEHGILAASAPGNAGTINIEPALTISIEEIDLLIEVFEKVLKIISEK